VAFPVNEAVSLVLRLRKALCVYLYMSALACACYSSLHFIFSNFISNYAEFCSLLVDVECLRCMIYII